MSLRSLRHLFEPKRLLWVGPADSAAPWAELAESNLWDAGFTGPIHALRSTGRAPEDARIDDLAAMNGEPFLAVVCLPQVGPVLLLEELAAAGCRAAVLIGGGSGAVTLDGEQHKA
ncbi:MAG: hypothetical protein WAS21_31495, partial [Geminicoccaceae bacterium]